MLFQMLNLYNPHRIQPPCQSHINMPTGSNWMPLTDTSVFWTRSSGLFYQISVTNNNRVFI